MAAELPSLTYADFERELHGAGCDLEGAVATRLHRHYELLREWASSASLIGPGSAASAVVRHYAESLLAVPWVPPGGRLLDVGSGAGFPGWILAAATTADVLLAESRTRKAAFLRRAAREAGVSLRVLAVRIARPLPQEVPQKLDCLTLRAVSLPDGVWLQLLERLGPQGLVLHWAGDAGWRPSGALDRVDQVKLPGGRVRRLDVYRVAG